jgi:hypothetical protein
MLGISDISISPSTGYLFVMSETQLLEPALGKANGDEGDSGHKHETSFIVALPIQDVYSFSDNLHSLFMLGKISSQEFMHETLIPFFCSQFTVIDLVIVSGKAIKA